MSTELARLQAGFAGLSKQMQMAQINTAHPDNIKSYNDQLLAVNRLRDGYVKMKDGVATYMPGLNEMVQATGMMTVETVKSVSATQQFTKSLADHKVSLGQVVDGWGKFRSQLRAATQEQANLQKASAMMWTSSGVGTKNSIDMYVPKNLGDALVDARTKYGMLNYTIGQIAQNTINWGKNTQWAGRQLTAGISMPLALAAAQLVSLSNQTDQALTKITKVYNTQNTPGLDPVQQQITNQQQLARVRQDSYQTGIDMAKQYGAALQDTLGTEADLAAIGKTGLELQQATAQITRISTLGELDHNTAMSMSISLMSAFKMNASQLGDAFNYINTIENQTSLTTQDFAEAIPRAGAALAATGVSLQQFGVLMTAMKEGGVNADQGANALKSAMSRILTPTAAARAEFAKMKINIDEVVRDAKGNLFTVLETLGQKMQGVDEMTKQTALKDLFGTYQVNRLDVALNGVSESLAGVDTSMSQTAQAVKVMNSGTTSWAQTTDQELQQLNDSISQKFKKSIETFKAEFAQAGMPILKVLTSIINVVDSLLNRFNSSPTWFKNVIGWGLAIGAIVGPIVMLVGLFANWWGNIGKLTSGIGNLFLKFKPLTPEMAANEAIARLASQSYDIQAQSAGLLAQKIGALTQAMITQQGVAAAGMGMTPTQAAAAAAAGPANNIKTPTTTTSSGNTAVDTYGSHAAPVASTSGTAAANEAVQKTAEAATKSQEGLANAVKEGAVETAAAEDPLKTYNERTYDLGDAAEHAANKTRQQGETFRMVFSTLTAASVGIMGLKELTSGTMNWGTAILNVSLILGALEAGGVFKGLKAGMSDLANGTTNVASKFKSLWTAALAGVTTGVKALGQALKLLFTTPWGIALMAIAALGFAMYELLQHQDNMAKAQQTINDSTQTWADILGFTNKALKLDSNNLDAMVTSSAALADIVSKMPQDLKDSYAELGKIGDGFDTLYKRASASALQSIVEGASPDQAIEQLRASLTAGGVPAADIPNFVVRFKKISLDKPEDVQKALIDDMHDVLQGVQSHFFGDSAFGNGFWAAFGNPDAGFTDKAKAQLEAAAKDLTESLKSAMGNKDQMYSIGQNWLAGFNNMWGGVFGEWDSKSKGLFQKMGIKNMNDLMNAYKDAQNGKGGANGKALLDFVGNTSGVEESINTYKDTFTTALKEIGKAQGLSGQALDDWVNKQKTMIGALNAVGVPIETVTEAQNNYNKALDDYKNSHAGKEMSDEEKLKALNVERAKLALSAATSITQMFTDATKQAGAAAEAASGHFSSMANALNTDWAMNNLTGSEYSGMMKDAMQGAEQWMFAQYSAAADKAEKGIEKGIQDSGQAKIDSLKKQEKASTDYYDQQAKLLQKQQDAEKKAIEDKYKKLSDGYDADVKAAEDAAKQKTDAIQAEIDALNKDDAARQRLFQNEQNRIERMAQMQNDSIDINSALNMGNTDEAARLMNNASATQTGWMLQDQQQKMDDASKAQQDNLQQQIDAINAAKDAYVQAQQDKKAALDDQKQAELDALDVVNQAQTDALNKQKQDAADALQAKEDATNKDTQNKLQRQQDWYADEKAKIQLTLDAWAAMVPTNAAGLQQMSADTKAEYAKLGIHLDGISGAFAGDLGQAIELNIERAQNAVADGKKWAQLGQFIDDQISGTTGFSLQTVLDYLKTGQWKDGTPKDPTPPPSNTGTSGNYTNGSYVGSGLQNLGNVDWAHLPDLVNSINNSPFLQNLANMNLSGLSGLSGLAGNPALGGSKHSGGVIGDSLNSRGNIPWDAPLQPSEALTLTQKGEYVVNKDATAKNYGLLEAINSGALGVRHDGGLVQGMTDAVTARILYTQMVKAALMQTAGTMAVTQASGHLPSTDMANNMSRFFSALKFVGGLAGGAVAGAPTDVTGNKKIVMDMAASQYGWTGSEWNALYAVMMRESGFRNTAQNPTSSAYGMFQFLDGTWGGYGIPKTSDPTQQTIAGLRYIKARYGDPLGALAHEQSFGWYDNGGFLRPGMIGLNGTGKPEPVFTSEQWGIMSQLVAHSVNGLSTQQNLITAVNDLKSSIDSGSNSTYTVNVDMTGANVNSTVDMEKAVYNALVKIDNKNGRSRTIG